MKKWANYIEMPTSLLFDSMEQALLEKGILISDGADEEVQNVQKRIDTIRRELERRCSW